MRKSQHEYMNTVRRGTNNFEYKEGEPKNSAYLNNLDKVGLKLTTNQADFGDNYPGFMPVVACEPYTDSPEELNVAWQMPSWIIWK